VHEYDELVMRDRDSKQAEWKGLWSSHALRHGPPSSLPSHSPTTNITMLSSSIDPTAQIYTAPPSLSPQFRGGAQEKHPKDKSLDNKRFVITNCFLYSV
jgi:hypothetical protein